METEMTFKRYQELAKRTINTDLTENKKLAHALYGLSSETGEISGIFQKELQGHEVRRDDLKEEVGDLLWFTAELCTVFGFDMGEIAQGNIDKLKKRYPDGFDEDRSVNRDLYSEKKFFGGFDFTTEMDKTSNLRIDLTGFQEYETQINAWQTIPANTSSKAYTREMTLKEIEKKLGYKVKVVSDKKEEK